MSAEWLEPTQWRIVATCAGSSSTSRNHHCVSIRCRGQNVAVFVQVDVPARDDRDDRTCAELARQSGSQSERTRTFGNDASLLRQQPYCAPGLREAHYQGTLHDRLHTLPHARKYTVAACSVDERRLPVGELLRRASCE